MGRTKSNKDGKYKVLGWKNTISLGTVSPTLTDPCCPHSSLCGHSGYWSKHVSLSSLHVWVSNKYFINSVSEETGGIWHLEVGACILWLNHQLDFLLPLPCPPLLTPSSPSSKTSRLWKPLTRTPSLQAFFSPLCMTRLCLGQIHTPHYLTLPCNLPPRREGL